MKVKVKKHTRKGKNKVTVVRSHSRKTWGKKSVCLKKGKRPFDDVEYPDGDLHQEQVPPHKLNERYPEV